MCENTLDRKIDDELEHKGTEARIPGSFRKQSIRRKYDFLWSTGLSKRVI
jgi:hypothetical protein